jgi:single-stranded-DNA-specific exonuclease
MAQYGHVGIPISMYSDAGVDKAVVKQSAAASDSLSEWRHLIALGLPKSDQEVRTLKDWLAPERGLERVTVFSEGEAQYAGGANPVLFPDRKQFGEVYAACRSRGAWLDSPDGFLQETASRTGWPLSTVRMMHEVFIELGFISADGASRKFVNDPLRRELEESARYRKAREYSAGLRLAEMSTDELQTWFSACHCGTVG